MAMKTLIPNPSSIVVMVLALSLLCMNSSCVSAKYQVFITNFLDVNTTLSIHCQSADDDLGTHLLSYGANYNWSFNVNLFRTTLFYCDMTRGDKVSGHFDVFDAQKHDCHDHKCYWDVSKTGLYLFNYRLNKYEFQYAWPKSLPRSLKV
ncbi:S-protein homolog 29-like [Humulus lupulus]|uniref:S-protein homolog 29-like n=1 Tax=Humulus lupulus TaxID=3486 RepID=UPI002B403052|nr:S-protein homolog 29-like [Humulus lupulus]